MYINYKKYLWKTAKYRKKQYICNANNQITSDSYSNHLFFQTEAN